MSGAFRWFDTHTHYNDPRFEEGLEEVLRRVYDAGILRDAVIGYDLESSIRAVKLAEASVGREARTIHSAVAGIHPLHSGDAEEEDLIRLEILAEDPTVAAIGEIGLDYHRKNPDVTPDKEVQQYFFRKQIRIARRAGLPVVIHSRDAAQDTLEILEEEKAAEVGGVIHCYSYSPEMAERFLKLGFCLGIGGVVTYPGSKKVREVVRSVPLERIVLETDAPYLPPEGHRGERNDSRAIPQIAETIAELRGCTLEEVCRVTWENACRLYRLEAPYPGGSQEDPPVEKHTDADGSTI